MTKLSDIPDNSALQWSGTRYGLFPTFPEEVEKIINEGESAVPVLLDALNSPQLFVTAHVILTRITGVRHETFPSWNGLEVHIPATGDVEIDVEQRHRLAERWRMYYGTKPRPASLF